MESRDGERGGLLEELRLVRSARGACGVGGWRGWDRFVEGGPPYPPTFFCQSPLIIGITAWRAMQSLLMVRVRGKVLSVKELGTQALSSEDFPGQIGLRGDGFRYMKDILNPLCAQGW